MRKKETILGHEGFYLIPIGEGAAAAQILRGKWKETAKNKPIRCIIDTAHTVRSPMHPSYQFDAFIELHATQGHPAEGE